MVYYKISDEVLNKVTKYLGKRPYEEVFKLLQELQVALELLPLESSDGKEVKEEKQEESK